MSNRRVMIVDDDKEFLEELRDTLLSTGYEVIVDSDSASALNTAILKRPDVILLDLKMPQKSGFELANELRQSPELGQTPIIAMTGFFKEDYPSLLNICGIVKCMQKPFNPLDVIVQIETALEEKK